MIRSAPGDFLAVLRDCLRIWWLAPLIPLLVVAPEAIQHVAEIRLGFFASPAHAAAVADDPRRMVWGYLKIAGLLLAIIAAIRFWGARGRSARWWDVRGIAWPPVLLAAVLIALTSLPEWLLQGRISSGAATVVSALITLATLPVFVLLAAGLAGDREATLGGVFRTGWLAALRMAVFLVLTWVPLAWLHGMNHSWAMGAPAPAVWALMAFDSLVVGLLAMAAGTAIHHGLAPPRRDLRPLPAAAG